MIRLSEEAVGVKAAGTWTADARAGGGGRHARLRCSPVRSHRSCRLSRCASEVVVRRELWCVLCGVREAVGVVRASTDRWFTYACVLHNAQREQHNGRRRAGGTAEVQVYVGSGSASGRAPARLSL